MLKKCTRCIIYFCNFIVILISHASIRSIWIEIFSGPYLELHIVHIYVYYTERFDFLY